MTSFFFVTALFLGFSFLQLINGIPMRCTQIAQTMIFDEYDYGNITGSATLSIYKRDNIQYVSISNVDVVNYKLNLTANQVCGPTDKCTYNLTEPFEMEVGNTTFAIDAYFPGSNGIQFFHGIVDDLGFYSFDGSLYTLDEMCSTDIHNQTNLISKEVHCCMAFQPAPQAPANSPKCTKFQSRTSILNVDDNYSLFATSSMNFNFIGNNLTANGSFTGPSNFSINYWYNDYWMCDSERGSSPVECDDLPLPNGDIKIVFTEEFTKWEPDGGYGFQGMFSRILIRDGQTLMEEGIPFTAKNNCYYKNFPFTGNSNQVVNNQFCCTEFENSFNPKQQESPLKSQLHRRVLPIGNIKHSQFGRKIQRFPQQKD